MQSRVVASTRLSISASGWRVTYRLPRGWLKDRARQFPAMLDPTVYLGAGTDCDATSSRPCLEYCFTYLGATKYPCGVQLGLSTPGIPTVPALPSTDGVVCGIEWGGPRTSYIPAPVIGGVPGIAPAVGAPAPRLCPVGPVSQPPTFCGEVGSPTAHAYVSMPCAVAQTGIPGTGPNLTVSGRLRQLADKQLYADDYSMHIDARPRSGPLGGLVGINSITIKLNGMQVYRAEQFCVGCGMTADWTFRGRSERAGINTLEVEIEDELGGKAVDRWDVQRSEWDTLPYEAEFINDAREFRKDFHLRYDDAWLDYTIHETSLVPARRRYNFPITPDEEQALESRDAGGGARREAGGGAPKARAAGDIPAFDRGGVVNYAATWWDKSPGRPFQRFDGTDCTNFVSQAWHFGGGLPMTKGWYIQKKNTPGNPFDSNRSWAHSWSVVLDFANYMAHTWGVATKLNARPSQRYHPGREGDAIMYDHGFGDGFSHLALAIGPRGTNTDRLAQHTKDRWSDPWNLDWAWERNKRAKARKRAIVIHYKG